MKEQLRIAYVDDDPVLTKTMFEILGRMVDSIEVFERPQDVIKDSGQRIDQMYFLQMVKCLK